MKTRRPTRATLAALVAAAAVAGGAGVSMPSAHASGTDTFYSYDGSAPLSSYAPGTVLKTRTLPYHVAGISTPVKAVQLLYRTTDARGRAVANVTSVLKPTGAANRTKVVSYQSFYDSLNPQDSPSRSIAGDVSLGGAVNSAETLFIVPELLQGYPVIVADTQGQKADFAAGPEYGTSTLDSIRAATASSATGISPAAKVGLLGYSGGAIATNWAAALAPSYAPDVNRNLVGATEGGLLVDPAHNLRYVDGSSFWAGVSPMAIIGVARAYGLNLSPYLSAYGATVFAKLQNASIANVLGQYPGLTYRQLVKPQYADPNSIPMLVETENKLNLGSRPTPTVPLSISQGEGGWAEGTSGDKPGIGKGDGVMIAGDVRTLARQYCSTGNSSVQWTPYPLTSHIPTAALWAPTALAWLDARFAGLKAPSSCGSIPAGNPLTPQAPTAG
ncbi:lipase family protein [Allobranchiibius sp. GilTou73]|uniref:lipase family protein n=1 Tax=Allobranchiibius sp. GilTou73 TaxID=2904523 RepID=UPI001F213DA3|nr:lipase family protein [Allobranchiibius sp. GilTou73]UIJ36031.1 lipase family protein [Allobranchiibius sp. GilTou73]